MPVIPAKAGIQKKHWKNVRLWIPYPVSDENQSIEDVRVTGNFSNSGVYREGANGNIALYVDPSDVRKAMLEKKINDLKDVEDLVEYFFGAVEENRIAYQTGRDLTLNPPQKDGKLNYFMYPYAEADGKSWL